MKLNLDENRVRDVLAWVIGRIDRIRPYGMLDGGVKLQRDGIARYRQLVAEGFTVTDGEIAYSLQAIEMPAEMLEATFRVVKISDEQLCDFIDHGTCVCVNCNQRLPLDHARGFDPDQPLCPTCFGAEE